MGLGSFGRRCAGERFIGTAVLSAALVAALGLAGCGPQPESRTGDHTGAQQVRPSMAAPPPPAAAPLPAPEALTDVLYRLADAAVPGAEKTAAVQKATPADAEGLDRFARALRDGGYQPVTFAAADLMWSDTEADRVVATITATGPDPDTNTFSFPMEFTTDAHGNWQLTRETADTLLEMGPAESPTPPR
ncbi:hypothetical protein [Mycolicibacterium thermoresistibile]|uniref:Putative lipoprotein lppK n=1 Tax=Mycolicibacterium thermoresistibile TaxID=1797 RepID=A0A100XIQ1_MYCTH|nr:hypothetical protein [Mycolicibacterium thermoresistibile]GAT17355.1 putative lipoprotein lppK [Mycolicibacterium thermoresistibile]